MILHCKFLKTVYTLILSITRLADNFLDRFILSSIVSVLATWVEGGFINGTAEALYASGVVGSQAPIAYSVGIGFSRS